MTLATQPAGPVTVTLGGTTGTDLSLDKETLTFTALTWNDPQTVTVSARDDDDDADDAATLTHGAAGGGYAGVSKDLPVTVSDNDERRLVLSASSLEVPEAGEKAYTVTLATQPTGPVTVTLGGTTGTDLSLDQVTLTFTALTWNDAQTVTVSARDDDDGETDTATLTHGAAGGGYDGVSKDLPVTVSDNDIPRLLLSVSALDVEEGGDGRYTVELATKPSGPVTVDVTCPARQTSCWRRRVSPSIPRTGTSHRRFWCVCARTAMRRTTW